MTRRPAISQVMRQEVAVRSGGRPTRLMVTCCSYCSALIVIDWRTPERVRFRGPDGRSTPELDHIEPLYRGGPHTAANLTPACLRCNRSRGATNPPMRPQCVRIPDALRTLCALSARPMRGHCGADASPEPRVQNPDEGKGC